MQSRPLEFGDVNSIWLINEQGLPGTGKVSQDEISALIDLSEFSLGVFQQEKLVGFIICLLPKTEYASLNYAWFNQRYDDFIYVDRVAVSTDHRNNQIGSYLYQKVIDYSTKHDIPITAEVSLEPPNPGSMRFHSRFGFEQVGVLDHQEKSVTMLIRNEPTQFSKS